jgi:serine O-acetyltransferase
MSVPAVANDQTPPPPAASPAARPGADISATVPDWSRERVGFFEWNPGRRLLQSIRRYQYWKGRLGPIGFILSRLVVLHHRTYSVLSGAEIPLNSKLGGGLVIPHPNGIVINPDATIGPNCLILQQVTIGYGGKTVGNPTIGGHVDIGAGAKVLGGITVGDHAKIGANAVVLCDVPPGATAVGVPAKIIPAKAAQTND